MKNGTTSTLLSGKSKVCERVEQQWGTLIFLEKEANEPVVVYAGQDEEEARTRGAALLESTQPEYNSSFVFLHHFDTVAQGKRQRNQDEQDGNGGKEEGAEPRDILCACVGHRKAHFIVVYVVVPGWGLGRGRAPPDVAVICGRPHGGGLLSLQKFSVSGGGGCSRGRGQGGLFGSRGGGRTGGGARGCSSTAGPIAPVEADVGREGRG